MNRPRHTDQDIERSIQKAEALGWTVVKSGPRAHVWGTLYCPFHERTGCRVPVYSTPRNPSTHARVVSRKIDGCSHLTP